MAKEKTSFRLGQRGNIKIQMGGCNPDIGKDGLEVLHQEDDLTGSDKEVTEYVSSKNNTMDIQINIPKFGQVLQEGLDNTKEMAEKWNWKDDNGELNWRDTPCAVRMSYDQKKDQFNIHTWNELLFTWVHLSLTKAEMLKILEG